MHCSAKVRCILFQERVGQITYLGNAVRLRERVLSHFYDKRNKEYDLCQATSTVEFLETGNELITLLLEEDEIRNHCIMFHVTRKKVRTPYCIVHYVNRNGVTQFVVNTQPAFDLGKITYFCLEEAVKRLNDIC